MIIPANSKGLPLEYNSKYFTAGGLELYSITDLSNLLIDTIAHATTQADNSPYATTVFYPINAGIFLYMDVEVTPSIIQLLLSQKRLSPHDALTRHQGELSIQYTLCHSKPA